MVGVIAAAWRSLTWIERIAFLFAWAWLAAAECLFASFTYDDVFISLRYAENLAAGRGYVFNPGEAVEGVSDPLWVVLLAAFVKIGVPTLPVAKIVGGIAVLAIPWIQLALSARLPPGRPNVVAVWLTALAAPVAFWGADGLETGAEAFLLALGAMLALRDLDCPGRIGITAAPAYLAVALIRPEGALFSIPYLALLVRESWREQRSPGATAVAAGLIAAGVGALLLWRWREFGSLVPNTYWAKVANAKLWSVGSGASYLSGFLAEWGGAMVPLAAAVGLVASVPAGGKVRWLCAGTVLCQTAFIASVGRDWMFAWRFIVPMWPALALLAGAGLVVTWEAVRSRLPTARPRSALAFLVAAWVAFALWQLAALNRTFGPKVHGDRTAHRELGRWLKASVPPDTRIAIGDCGRIPFESGLRAIDLLGLTNSFIARHTPEESAAYVLGLAPELIVLAQKDRQIVPGVIGHVSMFPVERLIAANPAFRERYTRHRTWLFAAEYDLVLYMRKDWFDRWVAGRLP